MSLLSTPGLLPSLHELVLLPELLILSHKIFEFLTARALHFAASLDECAMQYMTSPELMHHYAARIRMWSREYNYLTTYLPTRKSLC